MTGGTAKQSAVQRDKDSGSKSSSNSEDNSTDEDSARRKGKRKHADPSYEQLRQENIKRNKAFAAQLRAEIKETMGIDVPLGKKSPKPRKAREKKLKDLVEVPQCRSGRNNGGDDKENLSAGDAIDLDDQNNDDSGDGSKKGQDAIVIGDDAMELDHPPSPKSNPNTDQPFTHPGESPAPTGKPLNDVQPDCEPSQDVVSANDVDPRDRPVNGVDPKTQPVNNVDPDGGAVKDVNPSSQPVQDGDPNSELISEPVKDTLIKSKTPSPLVDNRVEVTVHTTRDVAPQNGEATQQDESRGKKNLTKQEDPNHTGEATKQAVQAQPQEPGKLDAVPHNPEPTKRTGPQQDGATSRQDGTMVEELEGGGMPPLIGSADKLSSALAELPATMQGTRVLLSTASTDARWAELVQEFVCLEKVGILANGNLSIDGRPDAVKTWISSKKKNIVPAFNKERFGRQVTAWWGRLQPKWRCTDNNHILQWVQEHKSANNVKLWKPVMKGGTAGLYMVIIAISWWASTDGAVKEGLWDLVSDVRWVFNRLLGTASPSPAVKRGREESSSTMDPRKRNKTEKALAAVVKSARR